MTDERFPNELKDLTDTEIIDYFEKFGVCVLKSEKARLIALSRIGAAVQPRPISEAPKDDTVLLYVSAGPENSVYKDGEQASWREHYISAEGDICDTGTWIKDEIIYAGLNWKATAWLPLSVLPKPKEPT